MKKPAQEYMVDGVAVTFEAIAERAAAAGLSRATVRSRVHFGDRSWERLLRPVSNKPRRSNAIRFGLKRRT